MIQVIFCHSAIRVDFLLNSCSQKCNPPISIMDAIFTSLLFLLPIFVLIIRRRRSSQRLPPGSLGIPIIGQSITLLRAMRANTAEKWLEERARKYGPISKLSLFGRPTVFIHGQAANKFVFTASSSTLTNQQTQALTAILGDRNLFELSGMDHKRVRDALISFLRPECLKQYVGKMDEEVKKHLETHWEGKQKVTVLPLMKTLTFNISCSLLFGVERGARRDKLVKYFQEMIDGAWSVPVNLPFTRYNRALRASALVQAIVRVLMREKRVELEQNGASSHQDLITCLLSLRGEDNTEALSEEEIVHNVMVVMVAGHETSSVLITFIIRLLANDPTVYAALLQEQEERAKSKATGELLTWEDLSKMKYTWRVAMETLRMVPPLIGGFRRTLKDVEYAGYIIPKGWQVFWAACMTHMDSGIFQEPTKFDPSRFENQASIPPFSFVAFGSGRRVCPGYEFARIETLVAIYYLVTRFEWKLCCNDNFFGRNPAPQPTQGLPVQIMPKKLL